MNRNVHDAMEATEQRLRETQRSLEQALDEIITARRVASGIQTGTELETVEGVQRYLIHANQGVSEGMASLGRAMLSTGVAHGAAQS